MSDERRVLAVDVGGRHVKFLASAETEPREFASDDAGAVAMVDRVVAETADWEWDAVTVGVPAVVVGGRVAVDPVNLGDGWAGFDFARAFGRPTKVVNDALMQALGAWRGGRMLFLGLGTGLGSAWVDDDVAEPMELGHWPFRDATFERYVTRDARERLGQGEWERAVHEMVAHFVHALEPEEVVIGGGAAKELERVPDRARVGGNEDAFRGGFLLWERG